MKTELLLVFSLALCGCQTIRPVIKPAPDPLPLPGSPANYAGHPLAVSAPNEAIPSESPPEVESEKVIQQAQLIEALIAQNDALTSRFKALESHSDAPDAAVPLPATGIVIPPAASSLLAPPSLAPLPSTPPLPDTPKVASTFVSVAPEQPTLVPNAEGVIDITALDPGSPGEPPNPFAVRALPSVAAREIVLRVQGIVGGETPCALVNDRVVECGHAIETLRLTQLGSDTVILRGEQFTLQLPLGVTKVRFF